ncbi:hypothetical protein TREMEDRAFT_30032 [Tremella mesenterica DSM 1558]|uniref:uncharacterized protein n=1 Tax=Tremella mesenterica (strain ATCC 24925 / CBS 8224 / DSM 1558 / NBRC 9311 / NRRL Y-6157 / RJB 2259-6 / UBC 559-6) TaxID=578456 RepID=UPI0003F4A535|nr:uncharacterized protein TREMEDRAFT_30032 [Tremella mesenterica DSM 1558]EIW70200.1 hypothetical protein TREMEDRAFT_30032 [Tremella mesenterica DSM 1558]
MGSKDDLPSPVLGKPKKNWRPRIFLALLLTLALAFSLHHKISPVAGLVGHSATFMRWQKAEYHAQMEVLKAKIQCPKQPEPVYPKLTWNMTDEEQKRSIELFVEAVRIPTQSYDDNGEPNEDPRWEPFFEFQQWLRKSFPVAHEKAKIEYINTLGILATFEGEDPSLKPVVMMSHYDVVPAPSSTYDRWTHPPFSGYNDGTYIWGRGSGDDKTLLVAQWEAITKLLQSDWKPLRTIIFSHGFDEEEVFARRGQGTIAPFLEKRYGQNGILMVIDEGFGTIDDYFGAPFALPAMGEKGYMDVKITLGTAGGHSSIPPEHTGIGIMSQLVLSLEENPFPIKLTPESPILTSLMCASLHGPTFPKSLSKYLKSEGPTSWPKLAKVFASQSRIQRAMVGTTTAVDVINGGVKVNALPELVTAMVNFRIDFDESVESTKQHVKDTLKGVIEKHGLKFMAFDEEVRVGEGNESYVKVDLIGLPIEPAPRTPAVGGVWELFAGTVKAVLPGPNGKERYVSPFAPTGNTDCKMYYNLTKNVYRFMGGPMGESFNAHTVDERSSISGHFQIVKWVHAILQNAGEYQGEE